MQGKFNPFPANLQCSTSLHSSVPPFPSSYIPKQIFNRSKAANAQTTLPIAEIHLVYPLAVIIPVRSVSSVANYTDTWQVF